MRFSGKAFAALPRALPPTGRSLCGTGIGYSCPVIEYDEIVSQPAEAVKRPGGKILGNWKELHCFYMADDCLRSEEGIWFSKRDELRMNSIKMKVRAMQAAKTVEKHHRTVGEALILKEISEEASLEMDIFTLLC